MGTNEQKSDPLVVLERLAIDLRVLADSIAKTLDQQNEDDNES